MSDFQFIKDFSFNKWVILDPKRAKRPNVAKKIVPHCPFCIGNEGSEKELYRIGGNPGDSNWQVRVLNNKFPFAPVHEIIIHSPDHHKNIDELPDNHVELLFHAYKERFEANRKKGQVYMFHNRGELAGESIPHAHTQLVGIPKEVTLDIHPPLEPDKDAQETNFFTLFCPMVSQWPDEVWITPKRRKQFFGDIYEEEIIDFAFVMKRLLQIMSLRHGSVFPFNYYIYPGKDWYIRLIPRSKLLGAFEVGTGVWVNTEDPRNTMQFIKTHFENPDEELIHREHMAEYRRGI
ncbi:MAG TPA: DUF4931 domain-containing protein [Patescibacteria group bacterium]|nr:DUF4931 domain-containing protein [Patescibacteria group bacterium]